MGYERKEFKGNAAPTTLASPIDSDDLVVTVVDATSWPSGGGNGKFVICINRGEATEEKLLCESRSGTTITVAERGHDGTTASVHAAGQAVEHVLDAETVDQVNRLANLMTTKGDLYAFNGTNPVRVGTGADGAEDDGMVLMTNFASATGLGWGAFQTLIVDENAPPIGVILLWYDQTNEQLRPTDGSSWLTPVQLPSFASAAARDTYFAENAGHACWRSDLGFAEVYTGSAWRPLGRAHFADSSARDSYYSSPYDGAQAYLTTTHEEQIYRATEWITISHKVTVSATQPSSPSTGDIWLQPVS